MKKLFISFFILALVLILVKKIISPITYNKLLLSGANNLINLGLTNKHFLLYKQNLKHKNRLFKKKLFYNHLNILWTLDINNLKTHKILPKEWFEIKNIEWNNKEIAQYLDLPISLNKKGKFQLKIYTFLLNKDYSAIVIQYDLIKISNQNLLWEFSRTFKIK